MIWTEIDTGYSEDDKVVNDLETKMMMKMIW